MSDRDIEEILYSGQMIEGMEPHDFGKIMSYLKAVHIDTATDSFGIVREMSYHHARTTFNAKFHNHMILLAIGEKDDIRAAREEYSAVFEALFKKKVPLYQP